MRRSSRQPPAEAVTRDRHRAGERSAAVVGPGPDDRDLRLRRVPPLRPRRGGRASQPGHRRRRGSGSNRSPGTPLGLITGVLTQWDGLWYLEIVRSGYPRSIPPDITYFQLEARAAFFPLYPLLVRAFDRILPGGDTLAALAVNDGAGPRRRHPRRRARPTPVRQRRRRAGDGAVRRVPRLVRALLRLRRGAADRARRGLPVVPARRAVAAGRRHRRPGDGDQTQRRRPHRRLRRRRRSSPSAAAATGGRSSPRCWRRSASSPSSCSSPPTPASRGRGSASSARRGGRAPASASRRSATRSASSATRSPRRRTRSPRRRSPPSSSACGACGASTCRGRWSPTSPSSSP